MSATATTSERMSNLDFRPDQYLMGGSLTCLPPSSPDPGSESELDVELRGMPRKSLSVLYLCFIGVF